MNSNDRERVEEFFSAVGEEDFDRAVDDLAPEYRDSFAESAPTYAEGDSLLSPAEALERLFLILTRQYGAFETVTNINSLSEAADAVEANLRFAATTETVRLQYDDEGRIVEFDLQQTYSPPNYADEEQFDEREVTIDVEDDQLKGTITVPADGDSAPGVVLLKGSGQTDRDYTVGSNKPYRDIAWGLATEGIAVLRYDERTLVQRDDGMLGLDTIVDDALAAVGRLRATDAVDPTAVFVGGWSFGGISIPKILKQDSELVGGILLDTPTRDEIWENRGDHRRALLEADWLTEPEREAIEAQAQEFDKSSEEDFGGADQIRGIPTTLLEDFMNYDHGQELRELSRPAFILGTGRERDTAFETAFERWQDTLSNDDVTFVWCPDLNHGFQSGEGQATGLESTLLHDNVDSRVVEETADWIEAVTDSET